MGGGKEVPPENGRDVPLLEKLGTSLFVFFENVHKILSLDPDRRQCIVTCWSSLKKGLSYRTISGPSGIYVVC